MIFGDLNLGIDEFFVGMTGPINPAAVFMIRYDRNKGNTRQILDFIFFLLFFFYFFLYFFWLKIPLFLVKMGFFL